jgi:serine acetyltransferase
VTRDVPPDSVVAGIPAKIIKRREQSASAEVQAVVEEADRILATAWQYIAEGQPDYMI